MIFWKKNHHLKLYIYKLFPWNTFRFLDTYASPRILPTLIRWDSKALLVCLWDMLYTERGTNYTTCALDPFAYLKMWSCTFSLFPFKEIQINNSFFFFTNSTPLYEYIPLNTFMIMLIHMSSGSIIHRWICWS